MHRIAPPRGCLVGPSVAGVRVHQAASVISRAIGLLGTPSLDDHDALMLVPCAAVHGIGLRYAIGVAFIDRHGTVMRVVDPLPRWGARVRGAHAVLEAAAGVLSNVQAGDTLRMDDGLLFPHAAITQR